MNVDLKILKENPLNKQIYGDDDASQLTELAEKIKSLGWIKPIIINNNKEYLILSGHRRVKAAMSLNIESVECEVVNVDEDKQLEIFLNENCYRQKTTLQLVKEAEIYHQIESKKATQRQLAGVDLEFPETQGRTNGIVAEKIGLSESAYKKARKVVDRITEEEDPTLKWFFGEMLNENIDAASKVVSKPFDFVQEVIEKTNGDFKVVGKVIRELEQEEIKKKTPLPPVRGQILYAELSDNHPESLAKIPIADLGEDDSVLFLWSKPTQLKQALHLIDGWGFNYKTCMVWNKDVFDISDNAEILTISTKGNPPMLPLTKETFDSKITKPVMVEDMIKNNFGGAILELTFDNSKINAWNFWDRH